VGVTLPDLSWHPTTAWSPRGGHPVELVVVHRWGVRYTTEPEEAKSYAGVIAYFKNPANRVSAHIVFPGSDVLARIVAYRLHKRGLPPVWSHRRGFCRHADLGAAGGGHLECPTTDLPLWRHFVTLVRSELERGGFRATWGR